MKQHPLLATLIQPGTFTVLVVQESSAAKALAAAIGIEEDRLPELSVGRNQITTPLQRVEVLAPYGAPGSIDEYHNQLKYLTEQPMVEDRMPVIVLADWVYTKGITHAGDDVKIHHLGAELKAMQTAKRILMLDAAGWVTPVAAPNTNPFYHPKVVE